MKIGDPDEGFREQRLRAATLQRLYGVGVLPTSVLDLYNCGLERLARVATVGTDAAIVRRRFYDVLHKLIFRIESHPTPTISSHARNACGRYA